LSPQGQTLRSFWEGVRGKIEFWAIGLTKEFSFSIAKIIGVIVSELKRSCEELKSFEHGSVVV
jgi:hypothetical protein